MRAGYEWFRGQIKGKGRIVTQFIAEGGSAVIR